MGMEKRADFPGSFHSGSGDTHTSGRAAHIPVFWAKISSEETKELSPECRRH